MASMFRWPFWKKNNKRDPELPIEEVWESHFGLFSDRRFPLESDDSYSLTPSDRGLSLKLHRDHLFAWVTDPLYQYTDFILEATLFMDPAQGYGSGGFIFRQADDINYYLLLVSTQGQFRLDVVFNGHPKTLIPWTSLSSPWQGEGQITLLARGDQFTLFFQGEWIAEATDDEISSGKIALAGQSYNTQGFEIHLKKIRLDSRPMEVETLFSRWTEVLHPSKEHRLALAESFISMSLYAEGVHQVLEALRFEPVGRDGLFLMAQGLIRQQNFTEGLRILEIILTTDPDWIMARKEKAHILYAQNKFIDLKVFLLKQGELPEDDGMWNLLGHAHFHLGQWEQAEKAYSRAWQINPSMVLYLLNRARSRERMGQPEAVSDYFEAARELYRQEAFDDLFQVFKTLEVLAPGSLEMKAIQARVLYYQGKRGEVQPLLEEVCSSVADSGAFYLLGLIYKEQGAQEKALVAFEKAAELEPDYYLYAFRLGEVKFLLGQGGTTEAWKAITLAPDDPWVWNLWGLMQTDLKEKESAFLRARNLAPDEPDLAINLADLWYQSGRREEAWQLAEAFLPDPRVSNWQGNVLSQEGFWEEAEKAYELALAKEPRNLTYLENLLVPLWKQEKFSRLEDVLIILLEKGDVPRFLIQLGDLAGLRGEYTRAEVSYWAAADQGEIAGLEALARHYLSLSRLQKLPPLIEKMRALDSSVAEKWDQLHKTKTMDQIRCASCETSWWAPKVLPDQGVLRIEGELPNSAPAGRSPSTGKVYCIGCAQNFMKNNRFICPESGENLKLQDDQVKWVLKQILSGS
ncbi:MAG: hypothetical protein A2Z96_06180 [Spirochaetes bacterium GWB1_48_6]|nr:MAG: hypothetical protein A2Z96_06180 [Spirochaetes bacterium GWB1_48_6]